MESILPKILYGLSHFQVLLIQDDSNLLSDLPVLLLAHTDKKLACLLPTGAQCRQAMTLLKDKVQTILSDNSSVSYYESVKKQLFHINELEMPSLVGYQADWEVHYNATSKVILLTPEVLLRYHLSKSPLLESFGIIFIQLNERPLYMDLFLAFLKKMLPKNPGLKIIIKTTSQCPSLATLGSYFQGFSVGSLRLPTDPSPVKLMYSDTQPIALVDTCFQVCQDLLSKPGDILILLAGRDEINKLEKMLEEAYLSAYQVITRADTVRQKGKKKIYLFTHRPADVDVAHVIDTGLEKVQVWDYSLQCERLVTLRISKGEAYFRANIVQGDVYRLYTKSDFDKLAAFQIPEIQRLDWTAPLLLCKALGVQHLESLEFLDPPPKDLISSAELALLDLGFLDDARQLMLPFGEFVASLPLFPRLVSAILKAHALQCSLPVLIITVLLTLSLPYRASSNQQLWKFMAQEGDLITLYNAYMAFVRSEKPLALCEKNHLSHSILLKAVSMVKHLETRFASIGLVPLKTHTGDSIGISISHAFVHAFSENVAVLQPDNTYRLLSDPVTVYIHPDSIYFHTLPLPKYITFTKLIHTTKYFCLNLSAIDPTWLSKLLPHRYAQKMNLPK